MDSGLGLTLALMVDGFLILSSEDILGGPEYSPSCSRTLTYWQLYEDLAGTGCNVAVKMSIPVKGLG